MNRSPRHFHANSRPQPTRIGPFTTSPFFAAASFRDLRQYSIDRFVIRYGERNKQISSSCERFNFKIGNVASIQPRRKPFRSHEGRHRRVEILEPLRQVSAPNLDLRALPTAGLEAREELLQVRAPHDPLKCLFGLGEGYLHHLKLSLVRVAAPALDQKLYLKNLKSLLMKC